MEVSIRTCPDCGAVLMGDETSCNQCGKALPASAPPDAGRPAKAPKSASEVACPRCGATVPRSVLRCRDCGSYMSVEIEAAMLAKQMTRNYGAPAGQGVAIGGGYRSMAPSQPVSGFAEVADDDDFDLKPDVDLLDVSMQKILDQQNKSSRSDSGDLQDDFEMDIGSPGDEYAVAGAASPGPVAAPKTPAAAESPVDEAPADAPPAGEAAAARTAPAESALPHSIETAGDVLLDAALAEERDAEQRTKGGRRRLRRSAATASGADRFLVFCPNGHRIQVHSKHRGRTGRCPNCAALFFVPLADTEQTGGQVGGTPEAGAAEDGAAAPQETGYTRWITDVYLHRLNPAKLKLKPGSLVGEHEVADLGLCAEHLLLAVVFVGGGAFRSMQEPKKKAATRQAMLEHLTAKMPLADIPVPKHYPLTSESLQQLKIVQPAIPGEESLFADIPVFGEGRIAIRIPAADAAGERAYLSFTLTQFREFSTILAESFGLTDFGGGTSIPMTDEFQEATCHYSENVLRVLPVEKLVFYKSDPAVKLTVIGRKCQKCGLVVSEDARKKEKIGGKSDSSVAKAKCPKCKQKFGDITLFGFPQA
ncbi:MAG TPA: hypothetical protein VL475_08820 [Planctomycetaceae bacterium]|nr:hypothetical protein [Planctomycetaceae bacterium]